MNNEEIIDYVVNTPENSNPNVLRSMLGELGGNIPAAESNIFILHSPKIYELNDGDSLTFEESADDLADAMTAGKAVLLMDRKRGLLFNHNGYTFNDHRSDGGEIDYEGSFTFTSVSMGELVLWYVQIWTDFDTGELESEFHKYTYTLTPKT